MKKETVFINEPNSYFGNLKSIEKAFNITLSPDEQILFAEYVYVGNGSGQSWIILEENGQLYEIHGFQSSVTEMSEDWCKEETSWEEIFYRIHHRGHKDFHTNIIKEHFSHYVKDKDLTKVSEIQKNKIEKMDQNKFNNCLLKSVTNKDIDLLQYMLALPYIENKMSAKTPSNLFYSSVIHGEINIMKTLLNCEMLKKYTDIYHVDDLFSLLTQYKHNELINYFIFEYKIDTTKVGKIPNSIEKILLANKLENNLTNENGNNNKMKL